jgi:hypothetical protein
MEAEAVVQAVIAVVSVGAFAGIIWVWTHPPYPPTTKLGQGL